MPQFYQTVLGRKFFEKQLPDLIRAAERIANALEEQNRILSKENERKNNELR